MNNKAITHVKIPNKFGVEKLIPIESLSEKQFQIQLFHCNKEVDKKTDEIKALKQSNIRLNKIYTEEARVQQKQNEKEMIRLDNIYDFITRLEFALVNAYTDKFRVNEIDSFQNVTEEQYDIK